MLTPRPCPYPRPWMTCFKAEDGRLITVMKEWDKNLRCWHLSVGGYPRRCSNQEALEAIEHVMPGAGIAWAETRFVVNPYVRHFFEARKFSEAS